MTDDGSLRASVSPWWALSQNVRRFVPADQWPFWLKLDAKNGRSIAPLGLFFIKYIFFLKDKLILVNYLAIKGDWILLESLYATG